MVDQTDAERFFGRDHFPRQAKLVAHTFATEARQPLRAAVAGQNAELYFWLPQLRGLAGDSNRAAKRQLATSAQRKSIDHANRRLAHGLQQMKNTLAVERELFAIHRRSHRQLADVRACHE